MSLESVPNEILELILKYSCISAKDVVNVGLVCKRFRELSLNERIWRRKLESRWPSMVKRYNRQDRCSWQEEYKIRLKYGISVREEVAGLLLKYYELDDIPTDAFDTIAKLMDDHPFGYYYVIDELMSLVNSDLRDDELTTQYYAEKAARFVQQKHLMGAWKEYLDLTPEKQSLEKGAVLFARWCQPSADIREKNISDRLNEIADMVKEQLATASPEHPALKQELISSDQVLLESCWNPSHCRAVLESMNYVLYTKIGFWGNEQSYGKPESSFINHVLGLKIGIPITLSIVYASIAKRLAVVCEPVNFPIHFLLRWKEHPTFSLPETQYTYIDAFNQGKLMPEQDCTTILPIQLVVEKALYNPVPSIKVVERMCRNLVEVARQYGNAGNGMLCLRNALELLAIIKPDDLDSRLLLCRVYLHLGINLNEVMAHLQDIQARDPTQHGIVAYMSQSCRNQIANKQKSSSEVVQKQRTEEIAFAVGMVMKHVRYKYVCVIYGWDSKCMGSREWIHQMGVANLPKGEDQPFYNVLVEDGTTRYAAQENLTFPEHIHQVSHPEIGKYFKSYSGLQYIPNERKRFEYPLDEDIARDKL